MTTRRRGFRRTALVAALSAGAVAATMGRAPSAAAPAAQPAPEIDQGMAEANAAVVSVAPTAGSLAFALTAGTVAAETAGGLAQALSRSFDLGLIGTALTAEQCDGSDGTIEPGQLPQPTQVDNRAGDATATSTELALAGDSLGSGTEHVSATVQPASRADVVTGAVGLGPLASIDGGRATAEAEVFPGAGREARASAEVTVDIAGAVQLTGLRWSARHRTGAEPAAEGTFSVDALRVAGVEIPIDGAAAAVGAVNSALAPVGFRVELPRVERIEEPVDLVRVTPLRILIVDSPLGAAGVRPALEATREARSQLFDAVSSAYCQSASLLLIGDIGVGVASGTGALVLELGGVEAASADVVVEDPFGAIPPGAAPPGDATAGPGPGGPPPPPPAPPAPAAAPPPPPAPGAVPVAARPLGGQRVCETIHPAGWPDCSRGAAAAVGIVGTVATAGTAALDLVRRRRALAPTAPTTPAVPA